MGPVDDLDLDQHHASLLESLPARPPTPPRETINHDLDLLPTGKQLNAPPKLAVHLRSLQTPPGVLPTSPTTSSSDSTSRRKRVDFSSKAHYQDPPIYTDPSSTRQQPTPVSLPSSTSRPVKGILKQTAVPNRLRSANGVYLDIDKPDHINIAEMLESTLQQLAGADRASKVDAYTMLFRGLKASSNLPDRIALHEKIGLFMQFIQRDLDARTPSSTLDILLINSALKLLHTFMGFQGIASSIPSEFGIFFVDHCVRSFENGQVPKEVIRHLMQALCYQNFPPEVMTFDRTGRLVNALHDIENHMTGKSIIQSRINVYEKLVHQCPQQMAFHSDWLQDMLTDMLSSAAVIRSAATRFGMSAAFTLNRDKRLLSRALELLNLKLEDKKYVEHITDRLKSMLQDKEQCVAVPRIWSVISLFIPNPDQWDYFYPWFNIVQRSFNHSNPNTKKEANLAWCRFAYRLYLDRRLDHKIKLVCLPLISQLKRKGLREWHRESVLGGVRNFLYYALQPEMNLRTMDEVWDNGVAPLLQRLVDQEQEDHINVTQAAAILTGLFDCKTRRVWKADRIRGAVPIENDELPAVESKWIRANSARVFELAGPVLEKGFAELSVPGSQCQKLWRALVHAVASASAKDVKLHDDTGKFVARVLTFLSTVWQSGADLAAKSRPCTSSLFLDSTREFVLTLINGLGLLPNPFMDKQFVRTQEGHFILVSSSSHNPGKSSSSKRMPLQHLFLLLSRLPNGVPDDETFCDFIDATFAPFFEGKNEKTQADIAQELLRLLPMDAYCPYGPWVLCASKSSAMLGRSQPTHKASSSVSGENLGPEFREFVKVLERALRSCPNLPWQHWAQFFEELSSRVRNQIGDAGVAIVIVEPLAVVIKGLLPNEKVEIIPPTYLNATGELIAASTHPRDKQAVDVARRRLWGTSNAGTRGPSFDPFSNMYKLLVDVFKKLYANIGSYETETVVQLMFEARDFFDRSNTSLALRGLIAVQEGLVCWLQDEDHRITKTDFPGIAEAMRSLWQRLCLILVDTSASKLQLSMVEMSFSAAFRSTHREVVRIAAETWNRIYGESDHIEYPEKLRAVLASLGSSVDVTRPGLEILDEDSGNHHLHFTESQEDDLNLPFIPSARAQLTPRPQPSSSRRSATPGSIKATEVFQPKDSSASSVVRTRSKGRTPKPKPRHEDSQVHFSAIESSPALVAQESQLLTNRQQEVRDRQLETAAMFPEMRSSPTQKTRKARTTNVQQPSLSSTPLRASTPDQEHDIEDCLTSTPTPRRGQSVPLPDQDQEMTDPPSSPPEPRSYPLLAELKSHSNKTSALDDWHFSSSPISGSPNPARTQQIISASQPMELDDVDEGLRLDDEGLADGDDDSVEPAQTNVDNVTSSQLEVIEDTAILDQAGEADFPTAAQDNTVDKQPPITPSGRSLRSTAVQVTPRSDNDEYVDALTSPLPPTPSQRVTRQGSLMSNALPPYKTTQNQSFNISASFETGLRNVGSGRIEIPLRSSPRKEEYVSYSDVFPESPELGFEQQPHQSQQAQEAAEALDVIEVAGAATKKSKRGRSRKANRASGSQRSQPSQDTQPSQEPQKPALTVSVNNLLASESQDSYEDVSPGSGRWWRKRKRSVSTVQSSGGSKRARHGDVLVAESIQEEIPESPSAAAAASVNEEAPEEMHTTVQTADELYETEVSFATRDITSPVEPNLASQELPSAREELVEHVEEAVEILIAEHAEALVGDHVDEPVEEPVEEPVDPVEQPHTEVEPEPEAEVTDGHMGDMGDDTDEEEAAQSQLAREEKEASSEKVSRAPSLVQHEATELPTPALEQPGETITEAEGEASLSDEGQLAEPKPAVDKFSSLLASLRNSLTTLRSVDLSREQYYQAEDVLFELKRELLEAESRGTR